MLYTTTKSSGLRNGFSDDNTDADSMEEHLVPSRTQEEYDYNNGRSRQRTKLAAGRV
jgi:hypothetical protein